MDIKILGTGCAKCNHLERKVRELVAQEGLQNVSIEKVTDLDQIMNYGIMMTPGLVINGKVKSGGAIPPDDRILDWLAAESSSTA